MNEKEKKILIVSIVSVVTLILAIGLFLFVKNDASFFKNAASKNTSGKISLVGGDVLVCVKPIPDGLKVTKVKRISCSKGGLMWIDGGAYCVISDLKKGQTLKRLRVGIKCEFFDEEYFGIHLDQKLFDKKEQD